MKGKCFLKEIDLFCCFCGKKLNKKNLSIEHIIPKVFIEDKKEQNNIDNLTFSCIKCNRNRSTSDFDLYRAYKKSNLNPPERCREFYLQRRLERMSPKLKNKILELWNRGFEIAKISKYTKTKRSTVRLVCIGS